jgi:uncharacterized membrane protein YgaE (UPF0421/DUF939 family)
VRSREILELAAVRSRIGFGQRWARLRVLLPTLALAAIAASIAWLIAREAFGTRGAFFAPVAAILTFGLTAGERLRRGLEVSLGVPLGVAMADIAVRLIGTSVPALLVITFTALVLGVLVGGGPLMVTQAAVSAILVVTLQASTPLGAFTRAGDALIGAAMAFLINFVIAPIDPVRLVLREAQPVLRELRGVLLEIADALERRDLIAASDALERARAADIPARELMQAVAVGRETASAAPPRRRARMPVARIAAASTQLDLAIRDTRVLARAAIRSIEIEDHIPPGVAEAIRDLAVAVGELAPWLDAGSGAAAVREPAVRAAQRATAVLEQTTNLSVSVLVGQVRSTAADLLATSGLTPEQARELVRGAAV